MGGAEATMAELSRESSEGKAATWLQVGARGLCERGYSTWGHVAAHGSDGESSAALHKAYWDRWHLKISYLRRKLPAVKAMQVWLAPLILQLLRSDMAPLMMPGLASSSWHRMTKCPSH